MNIREKMAQNPAWATGLGVVLLLIAAVFVYQEIWNTGPARLKARYTDDDGKTWFKDDLRKLTPFDHDGKQAFRVQVFRCGDGPPFIGWMEAYYGEDRKELESLVSPDDRELSSIMSSCHAEVKRPGDTKWVTMRDPAKYDAITTPKCPDGSQDTPQQVGPNE
jgi:hypothetical protein